MLLTWSHLWPALTPFFIPFLIHSHNCVWMAAEIDVFTRFTKRRRHSFSLMSPLWPPSTESECFTACSGGLYWTLGDGYNWLPGMIQSVFILQRELSLNSFTSFKYLYGLSRCLRGKESACQCRSCRRHRFNPWVGKILRGGNGNPLQHSCWDNPMDRGVWWATVHRVATSRIGLKQLSMHTALSNGLI